MGSSQENQKGSPCNCPACQNCRLGILRLQFSSLWSLALRLRDWYRGSRGRLLLRELCSAGHRIKTARSLGGEVRYASVRATLPRVPCSYSRNEMQFRSACIKSLLMEKPYLTSSDVLLFVQGWFLAEKWFRHTSGRECRNEVSDSFIPSRPTEPLPPEQQRRDAVPGS